MTRSKTPLEPCPQCGRPVRIGAYRCQGCNAVLQWDTEELARMATPSTAVRKALEKEFQEEEKAMKDSGIDVLLSKPCTAEQFRQAVASALGSVRVEAVTET